MERQLFPLLGLHDSYIDVPKEKMGNYAQGYDKANLPVRVNPGVLANEAYGVKTTAKDLIHYVKLSIDSSQGEGALDKILRDTRVGYFKLRSEEHTSELQSLMRISYAVFCLKKKTTKIIKKYKQPQHNKKE